MGDSTHSKSLVHAGGISSFPIIIIYILNPNYYIPLIIIINNNNNNNNNKTKMGRNNNPHVSNMEIMAVSFSLFFGIVFLVKFLWNVSICDSAEDHAGTDSPKSGTGICFDKHDGAWDAKSEAYSTIYTMIEFMWAICVFFALYYIVMLVSVYCRNMYTIYENSYAKGSLIARSLGTVVAVILVSVGYHFRVMCADPRIESVVDYIDRDLPPENPEVGRTYQCWIAHQEDEDPIQWVLHTEKRDRGTVLVAVGFAVMILVFLVHFMYWWWLNRVYATMSYPGEEEEEEEEEVLEPLIPSTPFPKANTNTVKPILLAPPSGTSPQFVSPKEFAERNRMSTGTTRYLNASNQQGKAEFRERQTKFKNRKDYNKV